ncbi:MAG TPA: hypothetical protein VF721_15155 [Pyrinomonadaceae bacterium]|jgi:hypothetical protein
MTVQQTPILNIGDKIGFVILAQDIDDRDKTVFFPVVEITERDGERAYRYQFPDGTVSRSAIRQSALTAYALQIEPQVATKMLNLTERRSEFREALERGKDSRFEVYEDWEHNSFVVVNEDNGSEYHVKLESHDGRLFGECECGDFTYRRRICKHLSEVLVFAVFTVKNPVPRYWQAAFGAAAAQQSYAPTK